MYVFHSPASKFGKLSKDQLKDGSSRSCTSCFELLTPCSESPFSHNIAFDADVITTTSLRMYE
jgi:hypothetical protein